MLKFLLNITFWFCCILCFSFFGQAQNFEFDDEVDKQGISFKLVSNLIVIPLKVNGARLSFVLDSGVNKPILFNLTENDSLEIKNARDITLKGLGGEKPIPAIASSGNNFRIGKISAQALDLYVILDQKINFSPRLGFPVHGMIGYDVFKNFIVEINYQSKRLKFFKPENYTYKKCKSCETFDLEFVKNKPYINLKVDLESGKDIPVKLLIDSGFSDALWLFTDERQGVVPPSKFFDDFLGRGLSGSIYGKRARVGSLKLGDYSLANAKVAFPDSISLRFMTGLRARNGSLGGEILKRFHVIFDYPGAKFTIKKNARFHDPFHYNMSGIELQHNGIRYVKELESNINGIVKNPNSSSIEILLAERFKFSLYPAYEIAELREGSPALEAGLKKGDVLIAVNGKPTHRYSLQEVAHMLNEKVGKRIMVRIDRKGNELAFNFNLKKVL